jgi:hypothetical protein
MTASIRDSLRYWQTSLADGALGEGKFTQSDCKRFVDIPPGGLKTGVLSKDVLDRVFRGQTSPGTVGVRF